MAQHNLRTVISFEVTRTLKRRRFWLATLIVPIALAIVALLVASSSAATDSSVSAQKNAKFSFSYSDSSGLIDPTVVTALGGTESSSPAEAIAAVKAGKLDAYFD